MNHASLEPVELHVEGDTSTVEGSNVEDTGPTPAPVPGRLKAWLNVFATFLIFNSAWYINLLQILVAVANSGILPGALPKPLAFSKTSTLAHSFPTAPPAPSPGSAACKLSSSSSSVFSRALFSMPAIYATFYSPDAVSSSSA
ncbi:MAG: hypothetical protein Q9196_007185 [Gyalolechia fulgens]